MTTSQTDKAWLDEKLATYSAKLTYLQRACIEHGISMDWLQYAIADLKTYIHEIKKQQSKQPKPTKRFLKTRQHRQ